MTYKNAGLNRTDEWGKSPSLSDDALNLKSWRAKLTDFSTSWYANQHQQLIQLLIHFVKNNLHLIEFGVHHFQNSVQ